jgi:hypothetical protein
MVIEKLIKKKMVPGNRILLFSEVVHYFFFFFFSLMECAGHLCDFRQLQNLEKLLLLLMYNILLSSFHRNKCIDTYVYICVYSLNFC